MEVSAETLGEYTHVRWLASADPSKELEPSDVEWIVSRAEDADGRLVVLAKRSDRSITWPSGIPR